MNSEKKVTVLMPVYNGERYLREAIDSILRQTLTEFEFLIVNDGSTDQTEAIVLSYTDPRIRLISQPNGGVASALNKGLREASGYYIARFDADDISYPSRLATQYDFMTGHPGYVITGCDANYIDEEGEFLFRYVNEVYSDEAIRQSVRERCPFIHSSVFYRKEAITKLGGYNEQAHNFEDHLLWVNLLQHGKGHNLSEALMDVRFNSASVTMDERDRGKAFASIKEGALQSGSIGKEDGELLLSIIRAQNSSIKKSSYHRMLGKKYLWNNYKPGKARRNLWASLKLQPLNATSYALLACSFLPKSLIQKLYNLFK